MQHNVIPVAAAKNMGIIGMKVFADGPCIQKLLNGQTIHCTSFVRSEAKSFLCTAYTLFTYHTRDKYPYHWHGQISTIHWNASLRKILKHPG